MWRCFFCAILRLPSSLIILQHLAPFSLLDRVPRPLQDGFLQQSAYFTEGSNTENGAKFCRMIRQYGEQRIPQNVAPNIRIEVTLKLFFRGILQCPPPPVLLNHLRKFSSILAIEFATEHAEYNQLWPHCI